MEIKEILYINLGLTNGLVMEFTTSWCQRDRWHHLPHV